MTPGFLNPSYSSSSFSDDHQDHQQHLKLFISPYNVEEGRSSSLSPSPTSFGSRTVNQHQDHHQTSDIVQSHQHHDDQKAMTEFVKSSSNKVSRNYEDATGEDQIKSVISKSVNDNMMNSGGSVKYWMSSKMRLIQKMSNHPDQSDQSPATNTLSGTAGTTTSTSAADNSDHQLRVQKSEHGKLVPHSRTSPNQDNTQFTFNFNTNTTVRVCSDCNTTTTPLWRSGPRGPKSLCNACGIRQRKARRAMAEAAAAAASNGLAVAAAAADTTTSTTTSLPIKPSRNSKTHNNYNIAKEKKSRGNHSIGHYKGKFKLKLVNTATGTANSSTSPGTKRERISNNNKLCFRDFASFGLNDDNCSAFQGVFPRDVAEAAILLMELSCHGFVHS